MSVSKSELPGQNPEAKELWDHLLEVRAQIASAFRQQRETAGAKGIFLVAEELDRIQTPPTLSFVDPQNRTMAANIPGIVIGDYELIIGEEKIKGTLCFSPDVGFKLCKEAICKDGNKGLMPLDGGDHDSVFGQRSPLSQITILNKTLSAIYKERIKQLK